MFELAVQSDDVFRRHAFDGADIVVGSAATSDVVLGNAMVSPAHVRIAETSAGIFVLDLGSASGTWVNGRRIRAGAWVPVRPVDMLEVGPFRLALIPSGRERLIPAPPSPGADVTDDDEITLARAPTPAAESEALTLEVEVSDPIERGFLAQIARDPSDMDARLVYADWLEEGADLLRAEALRLQQERGASAADPPGSDRRARVEARILELLSVTRPAWRSVVTCGAVWGCASSGCPKSWDRLLPTRLLTRRHCKVCDEDVDYCMRVQDARTTLYSRRPFVMDDQLPASIGELTIEPGPGRGCVSTD